MFYTVFLAFFLVHHAVARFNLSQLENVTRAFQAAHIVPQLIPVFAPPDLSNIIFTDSANSITVASPGSLLIEEQTVKEPKFAILTNNTALVATRSYVVVLIDPDVPTPQNTSFGQYLHFLGANFTIDANSGDPTLLKNSSAALLEYVSPTLPSGSAPHRYILAVYIQPFDFSKTAPRSVNASTSRLKFDLLDFSAQMGFGIPVAGNYFLVGPSNSTTSTTAPSPAASITTNSTPILTSSSSKPGTPVLSVMRGLWPSMLALSIQFVAL